MELSFELLCINCVFSKLFKNRRDKNQYLVGLEHRRRHAIEESIRGLQNISYPFRLVQLLVLPNCTYTSSNRYQMFYIDLRGGS